MKKNQSSIKKLLQGLASKKPMRSIAAITCSFETQCRLLPGSEMYKLTWINPDDVELCIKNSKKYRLKKGKFIQGGSWDKKGTAPVNEVRPTITQTIHQLFSRKLDYTETIQYKLMNEQIRQGKTSYWCSNARDLDTYFRILINAYHSIRNQGFKTQDELSRTDPDAVSNKKLQQDEIQVYLGRNGQLILGRGGTHRLEIAKILGIEIIPVQIRLVHKHWAQKCFEEHRTRSLEKALHSCLHNKEEKKKRSC